MPFNKKSNSYSDVEFTLPPYTVENVVSSLSQVQGWGIQQLRVPDTWSVTKGTGVRCLVIDSGCSDHFELENRINYELCRSFIDDDIMDKQGHSTHCLGIIGAEDNDSGMVGVAPECELITYKTLNKDGIGGTDAIIKALEAAIELKPDVISMSLGTILYNRQLHDIIKELYNMNIPIICASGNNPRVPVNFPAGYHETIAVTAFDKYGKPARFNSIGEAVDISGPGVDVYSTYLNQSYAKLSGTSMATPFIAGVVCLLLAKHRIQEESTGTNDCKTVEDIREHFARYATDKGEVGKDDKWGYGMIDPYKLLLEELEELDEA